MEILIYLFAIVAIGYLSLLWYMYRFQTKFMFYPTRELARTPANIGLEYEDVLMKTDDNITIHGWYIPCKQASQTVLFFHGNAGNLGDRIEMMLLLHQLNMNVLAIDYRGYGKSEGTPTEEGTYHDANCAWEYLISSRGAKPQDIFILGRSLGGGVATELARLTKPAGLILESTFTSMPAIAQDVYPMVPARWVVHQKFDSMSKVAEIHCPVLIIHSVDDEYITIHHGRDLYKAFAENNHPDYSMVEIEGSHGDGFMVSGALYSDALHEFFNHVRETY
jgi:pimeloyl-ACP methyl ester carboxylesterase